MFEFGQLFSGIGSFFGSQAEASGYRTAAKDYTEAARITQLTGRLKDVAARRNIFQMTGAARAVQGGGGLKIGGSALDVIHQNTQQGYLTKAITDLQTKMEYNSYLAQAAQAKSAGNAAEDSGFASLLGGVVGFFSDDRLKENVTFIDRRGDGLGIYEFQFKGGNTKYRGVLADEVAVLYPDAVHYDEGYRRVDYDSLGVKFEQVA